jgi:hypothetical protein
MNRLMWISTLDGGQAETSIPRWVRLWVIIGLTVALTVAVFIRPPIPQVQSYNDFADRRSLLGVPNLLDVASNIPFLIIGVLGLIFVWRRGTTPGGTFIEPSERWPYLFFFIGSAFVCFGSGYYHLLPNDDRLMWDRLPMTVGFMSFFAATITERINVKLGVQLLPLLIAAGIGSVLYWHLSELRITGGDLRWYVEVQYYPILAMPLMAFLFPSRYTRGACIFGVMGLYTLAKAFELLDGLIFSLGHVVSGHTLKHLVSALAIYCVLWMLQTRQPLVGEKGAASR